MFELSRHNCALYVTQHLHSSQMVTVTSLHVSEKKENTDVNQIILISMKCGNITLDLEGLSEEKKTCVKFIGAIGA